MSTLKKVAVIVIVIVLATLIAHGPGLLIGLAVGLIALRRVSRDNDNRVYRRKHPPLSEQITTLSGLAVAAAEGAARVTTAATPFARLGGSVVRGGYRGAKDARFWL